MKISGIVVLEPDLFRQGLMTCLIQCNNLVCITVEDTAAFTAVVPEESQSLGRVLKYASPPIESLRILAAAANTVGESDGVPSRPPELFHLS